MSYLFTLYQSVVSLMSCVRDVNRADLETQEVEISTAPLQAGAFRYQAYCKEINDTFIQCRYWKKDPRKCIPEGRDVAKCGNEFFRVVKANCDASFVQFFECLDNGNMEYKNCVKQRKLFDTCMDSIPKPE